MKKSNLKTARTRTPDPWFEPYREPVSERARIFVGEALDTFEQLEQQQRQRRRTKASRQWLWQIGHPLFANLAYHYFEGSPGTGLIVSRTKPKTRKRTRYDLPLSMRSFPQLLDDLESLGYLKQTKGVYSAQKKRQTTIRAGARLIDLIKSHALAFEDFGISDAEEVIILKEAKQNYEHEGKRQDYPETEHTKKLRREVVEINSWLAASDIEFDASAYDNPVDVRARKLYRYFSGNFSQGGRLFKGFWVNLSKTARLQGLRIESEPVVGLDYSQLNPTLAYAKVGCAPPIGDAYTLPALEHHRDGVKKIFNALLFDRKRRAQFPKGVKALFDPKTKVKQVIDAIHAQHPRLRPVLASGAGLGLMYQESQIMMGVLSTLRRKRIVALPIFDGIIVKASKVDEAKAVMKREFEKIAGLDIEVRIEKIPQL